MIEVIYKEDKEDQGTVQEPFSMPRNVRQIGLANGDYRIYIEDYVYTFLCSLAEDGETESQGNVAVLTGEIQWTTDMTCIYVKGALAADGMEATAEHIDFSEKIWQKIQDDKEQYFQEQEIVTGLFRLDLRVSGIADPAYKQCCDQNPRRHLKNKFHPFFLLSTASSKFVVFIFVNFLLAHCCSPLPIQILRLL